MNFDRLALELIKQMQLMKKAGHQKNMQDGVQGESFVLHCIKEKQGEIVPSEIGAKMGVSGARIATALAGLESKGLLTREIDINDRRRILVKLTQKGIEIEEEQRRRYLSRITKLLTMLGEKDAQEYVRITGRIVELMSGINE